MSTHVPWWNRIQKFIDRPWYIVVVSLLAALDLFIMVIPTDGLLVSAVLANRKKWLSHFLWVSTGSAVGALLLTLLVQYDVGWITDNILSSFFSSDTWAATQAYVDKYGSLSLIIIALSFLPQQPAVLLAALGGMSPLEIFVTVWIGRGAKYSVFAWIASFAPQYLTKLWFLRGELAKVKESNPNTSKNGDCGP